MIYPWGDTRRFNSYAGYFRRLFGCRVQKLSVDAGFTCPNRDGTIGKGGCTFCNNGAFTPSYCMPSKSVGQQIAEGIEFHRNRYRTAQRYLVYFQSFSNTYAPLERLRELYGEALAHPDVAVGMNIPLLIGGSVVTETVFSWPGIGMSPWNTASNPRMTLRCAPSTGATISRAPAVPWR